MKSYRTGIALLLVLASASLCAVPDSLLPPGGFKPDRPPPDPEATTQLGKGMMFGGAGFLQLF